VTRIDAAHAAGRARTLRRIGLIAAIAIAPVVLAYAAYYLMPRDTRVNYGTLLPTRPLADIAGVTLDGNRFSTRDLRGRWAVLYAAGGGCEPPCEDALYASRQARTIQNAERERIRRVWLVVDDRAPDPRVLGEHPDLVVARAPADTVRALPDGAERIYLIDPHGNLVLAWPARPDIKALAGDLSRLLRASRIG